MKINHCETRTGSSRRRRNPPSFEARDADVRRRERNALESQSRAGRCSCDSRRRMIEKLPAALPEEQAQCQPAANSCARNRRAQRRQQPSPRDNGMLAVACLAARDTIATRVLIDTQASAAAADRLLRHKLILGFLARHVFGSPARPHACLSAATRVITSILIVEDGAGSREPLRRNSAAVLNYRFSGYADIVRKSASCRFKCRTSGPLRFLYSGAGATQSSC